MRITVGGEDVTVQDFSGRKALRAARIVREVMRKWPELLKDWQEFEREYMKQNVLELDRATAQMRYGPRPLLDPKGPRDEEGRPTEPVRHPMTITVAGVEQPHPRAGEIVIAPSQIDHLTDVDWEKSGQKLRLPERPKREEVVAALFPKAFDMAEEQVTQLLALALVSNGDLGKAAREGGSDAVTALLEREAEELLDRASLVELIELAAASAEFVEEQVGDKLKELGDRTRPLRRLFGIGQADEEETTEKPLAEAAQDAVVEAHRARTTESSSPPRPDSSTPSPAPTAGLSETSLTTAGSSS